MNSALLMDAIVSSEKIKDGMSITHMQAKSPVIGFLVAGADVNKRESHFTSKWSPEEDAYLTRNLGFVSEEDMSKHLGRTVTAIHLRWKRDLDLTAPSKHPDWITATQAANMIGLDAHKITSWCDSGIIPYRLMPGGRKIRLIYKTSFYRWVVSTSNWVYFDWKNIPDDHLRRLCELRAARWGDEWWPSVKVAKHHGVTSKDVQRLVYRGELPGISVSNLGGRHPDPRWSNWFIRKSDAVKARFYTGRGTGQKKIELSARAFAWVKKARKMGFKWAAIIRTMGNKCTADTLKKAYASFKK